jgi:hypothetical protein
VAVVLAAGLSPTLRAIVKGTTPVVATASKSNAKARLLAADQAAASASPGATRILLVGNSVAFYLAPGFRALTRAASFALLDESSPACYFPPQLTGVTLRLADGAIVAQTPCDPTWESEAVRRFRPNVVFWIVSSPSASGGRYLGGAVDRCSASYGALYVRQLEDEIRLLKSRGARVVIPTAAYSRYFGAADRDRFTDCENRDRRIAAVAAGARIVDLFALVCPHGKCRATLDGVVLRPDGLHYAGPGGVLVAQWLMDEALLQ